MALQDHRARKRISHKCQIEDGENPFGWGWLDLQRFNLLTYRAAQISGGHGAACESTAAFLAFFLGRNVLRAAEAFISKQEEHE